MSIEQFLARRMSDLTLCCCHAHAGGDAQVWVTDTSSQGGMGGCAPVIQSPLATYMAWWRDRAGLQQRGGGSTASGSQGQPGQSASTAGPAASAQQGSHHQEQHQRLAGRLPPSRLWYLKDWHFVALRPDYQVAGLALYLQGCACATA
jgi:hypothetical protein